MKILFSAVKKMMVVSGLVLGLLAFLGVSNAYADPPMPAAKKIIIINNTPVRIYPVIETSMTAADEWLQAYFSAQSSTDSYAHTALYRVYINPGSDANSAGIAPNGGKVTINVPFYSNLVSNPTSGDDQYINWWNGMRVSVYDNYSAFNANYITEKTLVTLPDPKKSPGLTCDSGTCGTLTIYSGTAGLPSDDPAQLTEYTFGDIIHVKGQMPRDFTPDNVDYDISYVDHVYLPLAMEPVNNPVIGYTGTVLPLGAVGDDPLSLSFRGRMSHFINAAGWATYRGPYIDNKNNPKIPSTYNMLVGDTAQDKAITQGTATGVIRANWISNANDQNIQKVTDLFTKNLNNLCPSSPPISPTDKTFLDHIYGFVSFNDNINCPGQMNALADTPGADFVGAEAAYKTLQYYTNPPNAFVFNPYVHFIHGSDYMNMRGSYAFSIDDIVGNMHVKGDGIYIAVGGVKGLPNPDEYDPTKLLDIHLQSVNGIQWISYTSCISPNPIGIAAGDLAYTIDTSQIGGKDQPQYPCNMSVTDTNNKTYQFQLKAGAPFDPSICDGSNGGVNDKLCNDTYRAGVSSSDNWWQGINVRTTGTGQTERSYFNMPAPDSHEIHAPVISNATRDIAHSPPGQSNIIVTYRYATGGSGQGFNHAFYKNGSKWTQLGGTGTPQVTLLNVGLDAANIQVIATDSSGDGATSGSNIVNVPAATTPITGLSIRASVRNSEPQTVAVTYTPASGGNGNITYTANVNNGSWGSRFPCGSTYPQQCGDKIYAVSPTQVFLKNALSSGRPISVSLTAADTSGNSLTSNTVTVNPSH